MKKKADDLFIQQMMQETFDDVSYDADPEPIDFDQYFDQKIKAQGFAVSQMMTLMNQLEISSQEMKQSISGFYRITVNDQVLDIPENFFRDHEGEYKLLTPDDDKDYFLSVLSYLDSSLCAVMFFQSEGKIFLSLMDKKQFQVFSQQPFFHNTKAAA